MADMGSKGTQAALAELVGVSQPAISQMGIPPGTLGEMLIAYCARLREQAAGRMSADGGGLDLVQERAALARSQREGQDLKNSVARGTYAPIELLSDVLSGAVQAAVDRFDQIPAVLRRTCPDLPRAALDAITAEIVSARNEVVRKADLSLVDALDEGDEPVEDDDQVEHDDEAA